MEQKNGTLEPCPSCKRPAALGRCGSPLCAEIIRRNAWPKEHCVVCCGPDPSWVVDPRFIVDPRFLVDMPDPG